jgi:hypothetical protein
MTTDMVLLVCVVGAVVLALTIDIAVLIGWARRQWAKY